MKKIKVLLMGRKPVAAKSLAWLLELSNVEVVGVITDSQFEDAPTKLVANKNNISIWSFDSALDAMKSGELLFDLGVSMLYWRKL